MNHKPDVNYHRFHLRHSSYGVVSHILTGEMRTAIHDRHSASEELARTLAERASNSFDRIDERLNAARDLVALLKLMASPSSEFER